MSGHPHINTSGSAPLLATSALVIGGLSDDSLMISHKDESS